MRDSATYLPYTRAYENEIYKTEIEEENDSGMDCRGGLWLNTFIQYPDILFNTL
jgi:hypothetical protein